MKTDSILIYSHKGLMTGSWPSLICNFVHCFKPLQIIYNKNHCNKASLNYIIGEACSLALLLFLSMAGG